MSTLTKAQAIRAAKNQAKKTGNSHVVYFDRREGRREYYDYCSYDHYVRYQEINENNVVLIVDYDPETKQFSYE